MAYTSLSDKAPPFVPSSLRTATTNPTLASNSNNSNLFRPLSPNTEHPNKGDAITSPHKGNYPTSIMAAEFIPASLRRRWDTAAEPVVKVEHKDPSTHSIKPSAASVTALRSQGVESESARPVGERGATSSFMGMGRGTPSEERAIDLIAARSSLTAAAPSFVPSTSPTTLKPVSTANNVNSPIASPSGLRASAVPFTSSPTGLTAATSPQLQPILSISPSAEGPRYHPSNFSQQPPNYEDHCFNGDDFGDEGDGGEDDIMDEGEDQVYDAYLSAERDNIGGPNGADEPDQSPMGGQYDLYGNYVSNSVIQMMVAASSAQATAVPPPLAQQMSASAAPFLAPTMSAPSTPPPQGASYGKKYAGYSHVGTPSKTAAGIRQPKLTSANMCQYFLFGGCTYGSKCKYSHDIALLAIPPPTPNESDADEYLEGLDDESQATEVASEITETPKSGTKYAARVHHNQGQGGRGGGGSMGARDLSSSSLMAMTHSPSSLNNGEHSINDMSNEGGGASGVSPCKRAHPQHKTLLSSHRRQQNGTDEDQCPEGEGPPIAYTAHRVSSFTSTSASRTSMYQLAAGHSSLQQPQGPVLPLSHEAAIAARLLLFDAFGNKRSEKAISEANTAASRLGVLSLSGAVSLPSGEVSGVPTQTTAPTQSPKLRARKEPHIVSTLDQIMGGKKKNSRSGKKADPTMTASEATSRGQALVILDGGARNLGPTDAARRLREEQHACRQAARKQARKERRERERAQQASPLDGTLGSESDRQQREHSLGTIVSDYILKTEKQKAAAKGRHTYGEVVDGRGQRSILEESPFRNCFAEEVELQPVPLPTKHRVRWVIRREAIDQPPEHVVRGLWDKDAQKQQSQKQPAPVSFEGTTEDVTFGAASEQNNTANDAEFFNDGLSHASRQSSLQTHLHHLGYMQATSDPFFEDHSVIRAPKITISAAASGMPLVSEMKPESLSDKDESTNMFTGLGTNKKNKNNKKSKTKKSAAVDDFRCSAKDPLYDPPASSMPTQPYNNTFQRVARHDAPVDESPLLRNRVDAILALHDEALRKREADLAPPLVPLALTADVLEGLDVELQRLSSEWLHQMQHTFLASQELREFRLLQEEELLARRRVDMFLGSLEEPEIFGPSPTSGPRSSAKKKGDSLANLFEHTIIHQGAHTSTHHNHRATVNNDSLDSPTMMQKFALTEGWLLGEEDTTPNDDKPAESQDCARPFERDRAQFEPPPASRSDPRSKAEFYELDDCDGKWYRYYYEAQSDELSSDDEVTSNNRTAPTSGGTPRKRTAANASQLESPARKTLCPVAEPFMPSNQLRSHQGIGGGGEVGTLSVTATPYHPGGSAPTAQVVDVTARWRPTGIFELNSGNGANKAPINTIPQKPSASPTTLLGNMPYYPQRQGQAFPSTAPANNAASKVSLSPMKALAIRAAPYYPSQQDTVTSGKVKLRRSNPTTPTDQTAPTFTASSTSLQTSSTAHRPDTTIAPLYAFTASTAPKYTRMANGVTKTLHTPMPAFGSYVNEDEIRSRFHSTYTNSKSASEVGGQNDRQSGITDRASATHSNWSPTTDGGGAAFPTSMTSQSSEVAVSTGALRVAAQPFIPRHT